MVIFRPNPEKVTVAVCLYPVALVHLLVFPTALWEPIVWLKAESGHSPIL